MVALAKRLLRNHDEILSVEFAQVRVRSLAEYSRLHCGRMRRLLQPSSECFGVLLGRFELIPVPVAPSRLPVPLARAPF